MRPRIALPEGGEGPPSEFRIFQAGLNQTIKGDFVFDAEAARKVLERFADVGNEVSIDYEHQTAADPPMEAPAAGWCKIEVREGELWATDVRWTDRAREYITAKEYRYFSPWFDVDERGRVTWLRNVALTNFPATKRLEPLIAATAADATVTVEAAAPQEPIKASPAPATPTERTSAMNDELKMAMAEEMKNLAAALEAGDAAKVAECAAKLAEMAGVEMKAKAPEAAPDVAAQAVAAKASDLAAQAIALTGKSEPAEVVGTLNAWKQSSVALSAAQAELTKLRGSARSAEFETVLADGKRAGKLTPGMIDSEWMKKLRAKDDGVIELRAYLEAAPTIVASAAVEPPGGGSSVSLTADELKIAQTVGIAPDVALKAKAEKLKAVAVAK